MHAWHAAVHAGTALHVQAEREAHVPRAASAPAPLASTAAGLRLQQVAAVSYTVWHSMH